MEHHPGRTLKTIERGMQVVDTIKKENGMTIDDLVCELDMPKSTIHGYVSTFEKLGYLVREEEEFQVGLRFLNLASHAQSRKPEYAIAKTAVEQLGERTDAEIDFDIEENGRIINLFNVLGSTKRRSVDVNLYFYMHTTATGKAVLASWSDERVEQVIERWGLPQVTPRTITSEADLFEELNAIRDRGYALNDQQHMEGIRSVGATVRYPNDTVFGAISIAGPHYRLDDVHIESHLLPELMKAVDSVEQQLASDLDG